MLQPISLGLRCQRTMRTSRSKPDLALVPETQESTQPTRQALTLLAHRQSASICWCSGRQKAGQQVLRSACSGDSLSGDRVCNSLCHCACSHQHSTCPAGIPVAWTPASPSSTGSCRSAPQTQDLTNLSCCQELSAGACASSAASGTLAALALPGMHGCCYSPLPACAVPGE